MGGAGVTVCLTVGGDEQGGVADEIDVEGFDPSGDGWQGGEGLGEGCEACADREACDFAVQVAQAGAVVLLEGGTVIEDTGQFALERGEFGFDAGFQAFREGFEDVGSDDAAFVHGGDGVAKRCAQQANVLGEGAAFEIVDGGVVAGAELLVKR